MLETSMISTVWGSQARPAWIGEYPRISCRYSELKNTAPIITTDTSAATELPATTDLSLNIRLGTRGCSLPFSTTTNEIRSAAERARAISTFVEAKPCPVASVTPYARARIPPVRLTAPGTSRLTLASWRAASAASTDDNSAGLPEPAQRRGCDEEDQTRQEHASPADDVGQPAAQHEKATKGERVAADDPLDVLSRQTQSALHRGQRHVDDRDVQD